MEIEQDCLGKGITVADMKLLITAVITFDSRQIVSAFLNVENLKEALMGEISKSLTSPEKKKSSNDSVQSDVPMSNQLQSVFLRPSTPAADVITQRPHTSHSEPIISNGDSSVVTVKSIPSSSPAQSSAMISSNDLFTQTLSVSSRFSSVKTGQTKKCGKLDQLLRNHVNFTSITKEASKLRQAICTNQVNNAVANIQHPTNQQSISISQVDQQRQRRRKSTAPRYIPWQSISPVKKIANLNEDCDAEGEENEALSPGNEGAEKGNKTAASAAVGNLSESISNAKPLGDLALGIGIAADDFGLLQPITNSTGIARSTYSMSSSNNVTPELAQATATITGKVSESVDFSRLRVPSQALCGPFVSNLQTVVNYETDYQAISSDLTENIINGSIDDFSSLIVTDQSLGSTFNGLSSFVDPPTRPKPHGTKQGRPKVKRRKSAAALLPLDDMESGELTPELNKSSVIPLRLRCRRCSERFTSKSDYQLHLKSQVCSTGYTQTHTCQICGYCALTRQRLIVHLRTHSGERPHRCPFCSYAATQQAPLKRHIQNIHMKQGAISLTGPPQHSELPPVLNSLGEDNVLL